MRRSLDLLERLVVLVVAALFLGVLIVTVRDGITVGGGVLGLLCWGILALVVLVAAYVKAQKEVEEEHGERLSPIVAIVIVVLVFIGGLFALLMKMSEEGVVVGDLFPLTQFSFLTVSGPMLIIGFALIGFVQIRWESRGRSK